MTQSFRHWCPLTHICDNRRKIVVSNNGLLPDRLTDCDSDPGNKHQWHEKSNANNVQLSAKFRPGTTKRKTLFPPHNLLCRHLFAIPVIFLCFGRLCYPGLVVNMCLCFLPLELLVLSMEPFHSGSTNVIDLNVRWQIVIFMIKLSFHPIECIFDSIGQIAWKQLIYQVFLFI